MINEKYKHYNLAEVTLISGENRYIISNVNKNPKPGDNCESHLESITINSPKVSSGNSTNTGATGSITVIDYRDAVFRFLTRHLKSFLSNGDSDSELFNLDSVDKSKIEGKSSSELTPTVTIKIYCYSSKEACFFIQGKILSWSMMFSGVTPSINLSWSVIAPDISPVKRTEENSLFYDALFSKVFKQKDINIYTDGVYDTLWFYASKLSDSYDEYINKKLWVYMDKGPYLFKFSDMKNLKELILPPINGITISKSLPNKYNNFFYNVMCYAFSLATTREKAEQIYPYVDKNGDIVLTTQDPKSSSMPDNDTLSSDNLLFVFNGSHPAYSNITDSKFGDRYVIPMTSFKFDTKFELLALSKNIMESINGTTVTTSDGTSKTTNANADTTKASESSLANDKASEAVTFTFECYNVMSFDVNNLTSPIKVRIFNELGKSHPVSGSAMVRSCTYELSGAVVKATVECTKVFNKVLVDGGKNEDGGPPPAADVKPKEETDVDTGENPEEEKPVKEKPVEEATEEVTSLLEYIRSEDKYPVPISLDNTYNLLGENGVFREQVKSYLDKYGKKVKTERRVDLEDYKQMLNKGNFGLFALLIGVANCGVGPELSSTFDDWIDIAKYISSFKSPDFHKFFASTSGKLPYDAAVGGLGIAHWDIGGFDDIYRDVGFDEADVNALSISEWSDLLLSSGKIKEWSPITTDFDGHAPPMNRWRPVFSKGYKLRKHPSIVGCKCKPHKHKKVWVNWANKILGYKHETRGRIYQYYTFELWIKKFWKPAIEGLSSATAKEGHTISMQDAIRISRIANSDGNTKCNSYSNAKYPGLSGCNNATQVDTYINKYADKYDRRVRQMAFCRRAGDVLGYLYNSGELQ